MNVVSGYGVSNICVLGMNRKQIESALPDATLCTTDRRTFSLKRVLRRDGFLLLPSLGAIVAVEPGKTVSAIDFYVESYRAVMVRDLVVKKPFRGKLDNKLSFSGPPVVENEVQAAFGHTERTITNWTASSALMSAGIAFRHNRANGDSVMMYPAQGASLVIRSNRVISFQVFPAVTNRSGGRGFGIGNGSLRTGGLDVCQALRTWNLTGRDDLTGNY